MEGAASLLAVGALSFGSYPVNEITVVQIAVSGGGGEVSEEDSSYTKISIEWAECALRN